MIPSMTTKRITITVPADLLDAIRDRVGEREMSAYVTEALTRKDEADRLSELVDWLEEEHGPVTDAEREHARRRLEETERKRAGQLSRRRDDSGTATA
jgi:post-segregation antitoxin (ccd killing protein)